MPGGAKTQTRKMRTYRVDIISAGQRFTSFVNAEAAAKNTSLYIRNDILCVQQNGDFVPVPPELGVERVAGITLAKLFHPNTNRQICLGEIFKFPNPDSFIANYGLRKDIAGNYSEVFDDRTILEVALLKVQRDDRLERGMLPNLYAKRVTRIANTDILTRPSDPASWVIGTDVDDEAF